MAKSVTTLYIDDASIRLMVSRGKRISKAADAPLDMDPAAVTDKVSEAEIVDKIKRLLKANKVGSKKVIVGLSGLHCLSRPAVLPQLPRTMLDEAVVREAKRVLPVPAEQLYVSWQVISATEGKMQAFMVAMPHEVADSLLRVLQQVGLKPYLMDIKPLALARLVPEATAILVDVQAKEFDIVIIADGIPQPIRTVPFSETALSLSDRFLAVRDELNRTVQFYNANNPQKLVQHDTTLYISGELAADSELSESLTEELGYRVIPLPSPMKCPKQINPAQYLVNIGLALKELPKEAGPLLPNINALPLPYQPRQISLTKLMALPAAAVAVGVVVLLVMTVQNAAASIYQVQSQLDATNAALEQRQSQKKDLTAQISALEQALASTEAARQAFIAALDSINSGGDRIDGDLRATVNNVVTYLNLSGINHSGNGLAINGVAPSEVEVLAYARNLKASGRFDEVTITNIKRVEGRGGGVEGGGEGEVIEGSNDEDVSVQFSLTLRLKAAK